MNDIKAMLAKGQKTFGHILVFGALGLHLVVPALERSIGKLAEVVVWRFTPADLILGVPALLIVAYRLMRGR